MLNNKTNAVIEQDIEIMVEYDAFLVHNIESEEETLFLLVAYPEHDAFYQAINNDGTFGTLWIAEHETFEERFGDNYIVYEVDRESVKFNNVDYKYR